MNGSAPFPEDALEQSIRAYYRRREAPSAPFAQSWAALQTALDTKQGAGRAPARFNVAVDVVSDDDYAFILEDTLEETMTGDEHNRPTTTAHSPRMDTPRRGLSPRATTIAAVAAALILVIIAATIFTQIAVRRTPHPAATATPSAINKIALPNANVRQIIQAATAPDGSLWYADAAAEASTAKIGHVAPDGTISEFPIATADSVKNIHTYSIAVGPDGAVWFNSTDFDGTEYTQFIKRMTPDGVFTTIPVPAGLLPTLLFSGPDGGLLFSGLRALDAGDFPTYKAVYGEIAPDGHFTEHPYQGSPGAIQSLCVGPDKAIWFAALDPNVGTDLTHLTGHIVREPLSGQVQEFAVPHGPNSIASGSDGALWFSEYSEFVDTAGELTTVARKGFIGHITTAGVASEIPIDPSLGADQLVAGSDGAIWFTVGQDETGKFGRITPNGDVKTFTTGGNSGIAKIAAAHGALWLLDARNNLWRYRLPG